MNTYQLKRHHDECIKLLESIEEMQQRKERCKENLFGFAGQFPRLRAKYINRIDTLDRAIVRLTNVYKLKTK